LLCNNNTVFIEQQNDLNQIDIITGNYRIWAVQFLMYLLGWEDPVLQCISVV